MTFKQFRLGAVIPFLLMAAVSSCRTDDSAAAGPPAVSDRETQTVLAGNALLEAIRTRDYPAFKQHFSDRKYTAEEFRTACGNLEKQFGAIDSFHLIALPETPLVSQGVWLVRFQRKDAKGGLVRQELLFRIAGGTADETFRVIAMGFL